MVEITKTIGISTEDFIANIKSFNEVMKETIESYLTPQEVEEINNPKTKKKRIKQLIKISEARMIREHYSKDIGGYKMKLKYLLEIMDEYQNFQLFKLDSIGRFNKNDLGLKPYLDEEVINISISDEVLEISLKYQEVNQNNVS